MDIAVCGAGNWGSNIVRNFQSLGGLSLVCDTDKETLAEVGQEYPNIKTTSDYEQVLADPEIDGVAIVTPPAKHYEMAKKSLEAGKHTYVEKPLAFSSENGEELCRLSDTKNLTLMVGHILLYHPVIKKLQNLIADGELGELNYSYTTRVNLGTIRQDANVVWNLAVHDVAVMQEIFEGEPTKVSATGRSFIQPEVEDVAFVTVHYDSGQLANYHASWLDPHKVRKLTFVGDEKMAVFDDVEVNDKLAIHDKTANVNEEDPEEEVSDFAQYVTTHRGDTVLPSIPRGEPLKLECKHFIDCIEEDKTPITDGQHGLKVIQVLEAATRSLERDGKQVVIE